MRFQAMRYHSVQDLLVIGFPHYKIELLHVDLLILFYQFRKIGIMLLIHEIVQGGGLRQLWQTFMTGNYYFCFRCQPQCPATRLPAG